METKRKHSIFCIKKPSMKGLSFAAIYLKDEKVWVLVRGKKYKNGYLKYIHNGKEAKVGPYNWRNFKGYSYDQMESEISSLNIDALSINSSKNSYPRLRRRKLRFNVTPMPTMILAYEPQTINCVTPEGNPILPVAANTNLVV